MRMDWEQRDIVHQYYGHIPNHISLNSFQPKLMNNKQFGGNYDTTHAEINLLYKLKILNSFTSKYGLNHKNNQIITTKNKI